MQSCRTPSKANTCLVNSLLAPLPKHSMTNMRLFTTNNLLLANTKQSFMA